MRAGGTRRAASAQRPEPRGAAPRTLRQAAKARARAAGTGAPGVGPPWLPGLTRRTCPGEVTPQRVGGNTESGPGAFAQKGAGGAGGREHSRSLPGSPPATHPPSSCRRPAPASPVPGPQNPVWRKARCRGEAACGAREPGRKRGVEDKGDHRGPPRPSAQMCLPSFLTPRQSPGLGARLSHTAARPWRAEGERNQRTRPSLQ